MKRLLFTLTVCFLLSSCKGKPSSDELSEVYICTSEGAKAYHAKENCEGISNCSREIRKVGLEEVRGLRKPCSFCYDLRKGNVSGGNTQLGKYVYKDDNSVIHVDRGCSILKSRQRYENAKRLQASDLSGDEEFCVNCVSDETFERLKK
ncbi:MAG: hypothetical protein K2H18_02920 [Muribaculaceae bacterium]|nr:hypothetical protein [Muribaculaceae bacterium]